LKTNIIYMIVYMIEVFLSKLYKNHNKKIYITKQSKENDSKI